MSIIDRIKRLFLTTERAAGRSRAAEHAGDEGAPDPISCEEALRQVQEYLDGELGAASTEQVRRHFEVCSRCYPHLDFENAYREAVRRALAGQAAPPELRERVASLIAEQSAE